MGRLTLNVLLSFAQFEREIIGERIRDLYLHHRSLLPVVQELKRRGWKTKSRVTKGGRSVGGLAFDKCSLYGLLTNPLYVGKIRHKGELYDGEHEPLVGAAAFGRVQATLAGNGRSGGVEVRTATAPCSSGCCAAKPAARPWSTPSPPSAAATTATTPV